jgi:hypothetical protein
VRKSANRYEPRVSCRHDTLGEQSVISYTSKFHFAVSGNALTDISHLGSNFLLSKVAASSVEQEDLVVGSLPKALNEATEFRLTASLVHLNEILALDGKSIGNQVLPPWQRILGSEEQATENRRRPHRPKRQEYFPEESLHDWLVLFHLSRRGINISDTPDGLDPFLPRGLRAQFAAELANVNVSAAIERRELPSQNSCCYALSRNNLAGHVQQQLEQIELKRCQLYVRSRSPHGAGSIIHFDIA